MSERQAVFREQLRTFSVGDAPLAMEQQAGPVLPWPGMSETAGAPSSSSGVDVPQPKAVEPDPMVRRGLNRPSEGDPEIAEICSWISDVNVSEEPHPQVPVGEFTDEEERQALWASRLECEVFRCQQDVPAQPSKLVCVCCSTRRVSESDSWLCLGNDQNCVWLGRGTR